MVSGSRSRPLSVTVLPEGPDVGVTASAGGETVVVAVAVIVVGEVAVEVTVVVVGAMAVAVTVADEVSV